MAQNMQGGKSVGTVASHVAYTYIQHIKVRALLRDVDTQGEEYS